LDPLPPSHSLFVTYLDVQKKTNIDQLWTASLDDYRVLKIHDCPVYAHVNNNGEVVPSAVKCIYHGYKPDVKGYNCEILKLERLQLVKVLLFISFSIS
jgi:hypothetical protein